MALVDWLFRAAYGVGGLAGLGVLLLYAFQEKLLYVPVLPGVPKEYEVEPNRYGLKYEDIYVTAADGVRLHAWLMWSPDTLKEALKDRSTLLFFQANAGNIAHRLPFFRLLARKLNCAVVALSYRGYGTSDGSPTEAGLKLDSEAILNYIIGNPFLNSEKIVLFGRSLGGAVAIHLAAKHTSKVKGLIVENTFTSVEEMAPEVLPLLGTIIGRGRPANFLVRNKWYNNREIQKCSSLPIMLLSSENDEMVPRSHMLKLRELCNSSNSSFTSLPDAHHMDAYDICPIPYWDAMEKFFENHIIPDGIEE